VSARGCFTLHWLTLPFIVLLCLDVHLESWQCPIPTLLIFLAAFKSLSCWVPQLRQSIERIDRSNLPHLKPQSAHTWLVGSQRLIIRRSLPNFSDLPSHKVRNSYHPCWLIALASLRFLTIPDTFKSSRTITWFSLTILVDNLCRKSLRVSAIRSCSFAIWMRVFTLLYYTILFDKIRKVLRNIKPSTEEGAWTHFSGQHNISVSTQCGIYALWGLENNC
jgi:hypothetical protein